MQYFEITALYFLVVLFDVVVKVIFGLLCGLIIRKVSMGVGPPLISVKKFSFSPFLISGYVQFDVKAKSEETTEYSDFGWIQFTVVNFIGLMALFLLGSILYSGDLFEAFLLSYEQMLCSIFHPFSIGQSYLASFQNVVNENIFEAFGLLAIKIAAIFSLPFVGFPFFSYLLFVNSKLSILSERLLYILTIMTSLPIFVIFWIWVLIFLVHVYQ